MPVLEESRAGAEGGGVDDSDRRRCSCLPFCFWGGAKSAGAPARKRRRRRRLRLSWLAWPWFFRKGGGKRKGAGGDGSGKSKRRGTRLLLLLTASLQPKKALASVVSGGGGALLPAKVSTFGDAKKQSKRKPRPAADDGPSGSRQPQASATAATASTRCTGTAPARSRTEETSQPSPRPPDGPAAVAAGRTWRARAPSRRHSFRHRVDSTGRRRRRAVDGGDDAGRDRALRPRHRGGLPVLVPVRRALRPGEGCRRRRQGPEQRCRWRQPAVRRPGGGGGRRESRGGGAARRGGVQEEGGRGGVARQGRQDALVAFW
ncbi:hypothetical protein PVAP13_9KG159300 [Panicum virgatum]|uniref:Uncharacterized protein n=1 Tax=Panicum virgatum TaxID=38727 RepID=A0A8T0NJ56_PANVG|nr:hypothetical protein PVAP13_9KG159300 [Panicum virgatum]